MFSIIWVANIHPQDQSSENLWNPSSSSFVNGQMMVFITGCDFLLDSDWAVLLWILTESPPITSQPGTFNVGLTSIQTASDKWN